MARRLLLAVAGALGAGLLADVAGAPGLAHGLWAAVTVAALVLVAVGSYRKLRERQLGVDAVAFLALAGSLLLGELLAGAVIGLMVVSGEALERYARGRARRDLSQLLSMAPAVAHRLEGGGMETVDVDRVEPGDLLLVRPGEVVPVDGVVEGDATSVDESVLTGEPVPVPKEPGDTVQSGSVASASAFHLRARATAGDSAYSGIVRLVEEASAERAPFVRLADRYALVFVPVTLVVAGLAWAVSGSPVRALAVLVVATPCPLVLAAPVAIVSGISKAARRGIVVKDGGALEVLAGVRHVLLDKTGTLTVGRPHVTSIVAAPGRTAAEVLERAAAVEQASPHVLATALVSEAVRRGIVPERPRHVVERPGAGVRGTVGEHEVKVGSESSVLKGAAPTWLAEARGEALRRGWIVVLVAIDGEPAGAVLLGDELRTDAPRALRALRRAGVERLAMVTGDRLAVAEPLGSSMGIDRVYADRSPEEKVAVVRAESAGEGTTAMVGDGVNDAPALAAADLGVALGARGATASSEAASVVLVVDRLDRLALAVRMARRSREIARQSVLGGMGLSFVAMGFAALGHIPPVAGAVLQELIDVAAIASALRALRTPSWEAPAAEVPERWVRQLQDDHAELRPLLDELRGLAGSLDELPRGEASAELRRIVGTVSGDLVPHERVDEREIYPDVARRLGGEDPLAAMSRTHQEIFHLASMLDRLVAASGNELTGADLSEARRLLYALDAVIRLHFAQEEELLTALAPDET